jgi:hypothetical protein
MYVVAHIRDQPFLAAEMLFVLSKSWVFASAQRIAGEFDDSDKYHQADNDTENRSNDRGLVPVRRRLATVEVCMMLSLPVRRHRCERYL